MNDISLTNFLASLTFLAILAQTSHSTQTNWCQYYKTFLSITDDPYK
jgi:hypothetical protein